MVDTTWHFGFGWSLGKPEYTSREVYSLHARCTHSEVELRKWCLGQSEKSKIPYHLINIDIDGCVFIGFAIYIVLFVLLAVKLFILFDLRLLPTLPPPHPPFRHLHSFFDEYKIKTTKKTNQAFLYKIFNFVLKINYIWLKVKLENQKTFCSS